MKVCGKVCDPRLTQFEHLTIHVCAQDLVDLMRPWELLDEPKGWSHKHAHTWLGLNNFPFLV